MRMDIFEYDEQATRQAIQEFEREEGRREGKEEAREEGMRHLIEACFELQCPRRVALEKLAEKYGLTGEEAEERMQKYWREQDT